MRIAAMSVEHFLDELVDGTLVIVPGDRPDILLADAGRAAARRRRADQRLRARDRSAAPAQRAPFPVLRTCERTDGAAATVHAVRPR